MVIEMDTDDMIKDVMKRKAVVKLYLLKEMSPPSPGSPKSDAPLGRREGSDDDSESQEEPETDEEEGPPPWPQWNSLHWGKRPTRPTRAAKRQAQEAVTILRPSARGAAKKAQLAITQVMLDENKSKHREDPDDSEDPDDTDDPEDPDGPEDAEDLEDSEYLDSEDPDDAEDHQRKGTKRTAAQTTAKKKKGRVDLSEYELERLENIRRNRAFLTSINIQEAMDDLKKMTRPTKVPKRRPESETLPPRKSSRLENIKDIPPEPTSSDDDGDDHGNERGPVPMKALNLDEGTELPPELLKLFTEDSIHDEKVTQDMEGYQSALMNMKEIEKDATRVVRLLTCAAFHPATTSLLLAAGSHTGHLGLYHVGSDCGGDRDGVLLFKPHTGPVDCLAFSRTHPANLLSLASNGSIRCLDVETRLFNEVYNTEDTLKGFDFLSDDCSTLVAGHLHKGLAALGIIDTRCKRTCQARPPLDGRVIRCISVHPLQKHYTVVSESRVVNIYDCRSLGRSVNKPVCQLLGHSDATYSGYFSPSTGNRVLTSCQDNVIRVYDTTSMTSSPRLMTTVKIGTDSCSTGVKPRAIWDPKQEDCFAVGSLMWPRTLKVFHESGKSLHTLFESNKVLAVSAFHPSRNALAGAVASGYMHVFSG